VDLPNHIIRLEGDQTKNAEPRILPLTAELIMMLALVQPKAGHVFSAKNLRKAWMQACTEVGLDGLLFHDLRRSAIRNMIAAGISEHVAMKISGHKTQSIFRRYNIVSTQDVVNAMSRVEAARQPILGENTGKILPSASAESK
jgi:integrase